MYGKQTKYESMLWNKIVDYIYIYTYFTITINMH